MITILDSVNELNKLNSSRDFTSSSYGKDFDSDAKARMAMGSMLILPLLHVYSEIIKGFCLEVGPHLNPLLNTSLFNIDQLTFVDPDEGIVDHLSEIFRDDNRVRTVLSKIDDSALPDVLGHLVDVTVVSQALNYADLLVALDTITEFTKPNGYLFINNVIDYGIPSLFSANRPQSDNEILAILQQLGWTIEEAIKLPSCLKQQLHPRLILVAKKSNGSITKRNS